MLPVSGSREVFFDQPHDDAVRQKKAGLAVRNDTQYGRFRFLW